MREMLILYLRLSRGMMYSEAEEVVESWERSFFVFVGLLAHIKERREMTD